MTFIYSLDINHYIYHYMNHDINHDINQYHLIIILVII